MKEETEEKMLNLYRSFLWVHIDDLLLAPERSTSDHKWYRCNDCGNYCSNRPHLSDLLFCSICGTHKWIDRGQGTKIKSVLKNEEIKFRGLMDRFKDLPDTLTVDEAFKLRDEQGCPLEFLETRTNYSELLAMIGSKKVRRKKAVYTGGE